MTSTEFFVDILNELSAVAIATVASDGVVRSANRGFRRLLPPEAREAEPIVATPYFLSPSLRQLTAMAVSGDAPCY